MSWRRRNPVSKFLQNRRWLYPCYEQFFTWIELEQQGDGNGVLIKGAARFAHSLTAWRELRSPSQQVGEGYSGTVELLVEPHTEVVQRYPHCQACLQPSQIVDPLPAESEGIVQFVVDVLHDLADAGGSTPQALRPGFAAVAFGRTDDDPRPVALHPAPVVLGTPEAFVGYVVEFFQPPILRSADGGSAGGASST